MPYPDERYPADPDFPRPQSTKTTKENDLMDRDWYEVVCSYIEDILSGGALPQYQVYRGNASNQAEATDVIKIYDDGVEITTDHPLDGTAKLVPVILLEEGEGDPDVSAEPDGVLVVWYVP